MDGAGDGDHAEVSIRPRRFGRGRHLVVYGSQASFWFQSAPGVSAGGDGDRLTPRGNNECFNPPPAFRPGETLAIYACDYRVLEFQSAPGVSAGGDRIQTDCAQGRLVFQSAPGVSAGGDPLPLTLPGIPWQFQSAPGVSAGGDANAENKTAIEIVSIRPRRFGRGRRRGSAAKGSARGVSIRPRRFGRGRPCSSPVMHRSTRVSIRPRRFGRGRRSGRSGPTGQGGFNPPPAFRPGETSQSRSR